jgi:glycerol kinase
MATITPPLLGLGIYKSLDDLVNLSGKQNSFHPQMKAAEAHQFHNGWLAAVKRVL